MRSDVLVEPALASIDGLCKSSVHRFLTRTSPVDGAFGWAATKLDASGAPEVSGDWSGLFL